jgi:hypothetical protein
MHGEHAGVGDRAGGDDLVVGFRGPGLRRLLTSGRGLGGLLTTRGWRRALGSCAGGVGAREHAEDGKCQEDAQKPH